MPLARLFLGGPHRDTGPARVPDIGPRRSSRAAAHRAMQVVAIAYVVGLLLAIVAYRSIFAALGAVGPVLTAYGLVVCAYVVTRFALSACYRPSADHGLEPRVAIIVPAFNEGESVVAGVESIFDLDYPHDKLQVVLVNDGSTDDTLHHMRTAAARYEGVQVIDFERNQGKRAAMAAGIRVTDAEVLAFVDSDSVLEPDALRILVQGFHDPRVGAVAGYTGVLNTHETWLTRMQAVRYLVAFKVIKAAESVFGCVTCCPGCFAAYRREAVMPHLDAWEHQRFLGCPATFGDDRSLTNFVLRDWRVVYEDRAISETIVPPGFRQFMHQQVRWKRSWARESMILSTIIWRKHPLASIATFIAITLPIAGPITAIRALWWVPVVNDTGSPLVYILGTYVMGLLYGLYYAAWQRRYSVTWFYGVHFVFFYLGLLLWQTYYAMFTCWKSTWGTRPSTHASDPGVAQVVQA